MSLVVMWTDFEEVVINRVTATIGSPFNIIDLCVAHLLLGTHQLMWIGTEELVVVIATKEIFSLRFLLYTCHWGFAWGKLLRVSGCRYLRDTSMGV